VLIYWLTTNLWSMGQQFWVIRNNPQPGTPAYTAWEERESAKRARKNGGVDPEAPVQVIAPAVVRQQPKKQTRSQRQKKLPGEGAETTGGTETTSSPESPEAAPTTPNE
jgi:YidC/Oxa1 family membrane protein insertase